MALVTCSIIIPAEEVRAGDNVPGFGIVTAVDPDPRIDSTLVIWINALGDSSARRPDLMVTVQRPRYEVDSIQITRYVVRDLTSGMTVRDTRGQTRIAEDPGTAGAWAATLNNSDREPLL